MNNLEAWEKILSQVELITVDLQREQERSNALELEIQLLRERAHRDPRAARAVAAVDAFMEANQDSLEQLRVSAEKIIENMKELNRRLAQDSVASAEKSAPPNADRETKPARRNRRSFA
jgi:hypothetical protein